ncbi:reverse transcriptase domain-containing protein [Tanacetum coccineum]
MPGEHNITYRPRTSVKGQILADFLVEKLDEAPPDTSVVEIPQEPWTLFTDGSSCVDDHGMLNFDMPGGKRSFNLRLWFRFTASNNEAEYEALILAFGLTAQKGVSKCLGRKYLKKYPHYKRGSGDSSRGRGTNMDDPIMEYLKDGTLPDDRKEASKLRIKAREYELLEGVLYRRSFLKPWLSMHVRPRSVVAKAMRLGYYWPTMHRDARDMIHKSGPFPEGPGKVKFFIVAMDYFTKWIEPKAVATISGSQVKKSVWDNIVYRFGLSGEIVSDNVKHPQSNGLVERENRSLGEGIKARLGEGNKNWIEELSHVLWAYRTMIKSSHDDTPFSLTYGTEAVIHAKVGMPTYRTQYHAVDGGKLGPKWEGPYEVTEALEDGAYRLRSMDGTVLPGNGGTSDNSQEMLCSEQSAVDEFALCLGLPNKRWAKRWIVVVLDVVHLPRQLPQSVWQHPPTESPAPEERYELLNSELLNSELLNSELLNSELLNSELLNSELLNGELLNSELLNSELLNSELLNSELLNGELSNSELLIGSGLLRIFLCEEKGFSKTAITFDPYVVPTGKDNFIVSASRPNMVPAGRTIVSPGSIIFGPGSKDLSRVGSNKWYQSLVALDLGLISRVVCQCKQVSHNAAVLPYPKDICFPRSETSGLGFAASL